MMCSTCPKSRKANSPINREPFKLQPFLESVISIVWLQAKEHGLAFETALADITADTFIGDSMRINQILLNLLSNALKFTLKGGTVRLQVKQFILKNNEVRLRFSISDTGIGMSEEFLSRLFIPFEQAPSTISKKYGGTGLGMAITKNLVNLLGGTIHVKAVPEKARQLR